MPPRRQTPKPAKIEVPDADRMLLQTFRLHCQTRHPYMRFRTKGEHDADHRLHDNVLDHVHVRGYEDDDDSAESGEPDQNSNI